MTVPLPLRTQGMELLAGAVRRVVPARARGRPGRLPRGHAGKDSQRSRLPQDGAPLEARRDPDPVQLGGLRDGRLAQPGPDQMLPRAAPLPRGRVYIFMYI